MKKLFLVPVLLLGFAFFAGCEGQPNPVEAPLTEQTGGGVLAKITILDQIDAVIPFANTEFLPCANGGSGEDVDIAGTARLRVKVFRDARGGVHVNASARPLDATGVGQITGDIYRGAGGVEKYVENSGAAGLPFEANLTVVINLIGPNNRFHLHIHAHITVNANGDVTRNVFSETRDCN